MHVLFFSHYFPPEGNAPASRTYENCRRWVAAGHRVTVITCVPNQPDGVAYAGYRNRLRQREQLDGIEVVRVWTYLAANRGTVRRVANYVSYMLSALLFSLFLPRPDIVVATSPQFFCGWAGVIAAHVRRVPLVLEIRDLWPDSIAAVAALRNQALLGFLEQLESWLYQAADHIVTVGEGYREELLRKGCHVAVTDLPGAHLDSLVDELKRAFGPRVIGVPLDVSDTASVTEGFATVIRTWGGIDLLVANAGVALVSSLAEMDIAAFRRLERVNVEGTMLLLAEAARHFKVQGTGGDIVVVSTKNVFAPGARFGAYSATKAAAHQLGRIASLELAEMDVRVNMVAPEAVFSHGSRESGLWTEIGPDRMRARGLDESGLEQYYRSRNLLKARVTATHVASAVLFFATRQTPTTGATLPVDGGLPDAAPR